MIEVCVCMLVEKIILNLNIESSLKIFHSQCVEFYRLGGEDRMENAPRWFRRSQKGVKVNYKSIFKYKGSN